MTIERRAQSDDELWADLAWLRAAQDIPAVLETLVAQHAPRMFALVEQDIDLLEDQVFGWGLQFDDHAYVVACDGASQVSCTTADHAVAMFAVAGRDLRLIWHATTTGPTARASRRRVLRARRRAIR